MKSPMFSSNLDRLSPTSHQRPDRKGTRIRRRNRGVTGKFLGTPEAVRNVSYFFLLSVEGSSWMTSHIFWPSHPLCYDSSQRCSALLNVTILLQHRHLSSQKKNYKNGFESNFNYFKTFLQKTNRSFYLIFILTLHHCCPPPFKCHILSQNYWHPPPCQCDFIDVTPYWIPCLLIDQWSIS